MPQRRKTLSEQGGKLFLLRLQLGMTQIELAELVGIHPRTIRRIENGERHSQEIFQRTEKVLQEQIQGVSHGFRAFRF